MTELASRTKYYCCLRVRKTIFIFLLLIASSSAFSQSKLPGQNEFPIVPHFPDSTPQNKVLSLNPRVYRSNDTVWIYSGICKTLQIRTFTGKDAPKMLNTIRKPVLLKMNGNIQYDFIYRSLVDTPFSQENFQQHIIQTTLDFTIRENYPVRVTMLTRQSNSPYFDDITDVSVQFSHRDFVQQLRSKLSKQLPEVLSQVKLTELEKLYQQKKWLAEALTNWINHPGRLQEIIESKEKEAAVRLMSAGAVLLDSHDIQLPRTIPAVPSTRFIRKKVFAEAEQYMQALRDSLKAQADSVVSAQKEKKDSLLQNDIMGRYREKKEELEKLLKEIKEYEGAIKTLKKSLHDSVAMLKQHLSQIKDPAQLKTFIKDHKLSIKELPKGWQALSAINTIGIGRTWVDYSDLTVKNVSLTGVNAELNPGKFYLAFAMGRVNYRFRDFIIKNNDRPKQNLFLLRAGIGRKDGNHLIASWYDGKRNLLNSFNSPITPASNLERVIGMSVQARLQASPDNYIILESAKSSFHSTGTVGQPQSALIGKVWNFKDRTNEAFSIKLYSSLPRSSTKINGYYRKMGEHFQSFNLQPVNVNQDAWQFRVQQSLWKKRLLLDAGVRKNDFNSPFINPGLTSKTVFKSAQATLRISKYPFLSVGYYPSSQLTLLDNNVLVENQYNTFSTVVSHSYRVKKISMSSSVVFLKFYNSGADTGFIYYNASSWTANQFVFIRNLQLQSGLTITDQRDLSVKTLEQSLTYQLKSWLTVSGGLKYNRVNNDQTLWGASAGLGLIIRKMGTVQASYDKSYLPGTARNLLPVDMGRLTYYRSF